MGDMFSDREKSVCDKSLLRVRGIEAVRAEIRETEEAVLQLVRSARQFVEQSRKMNLVRRVAYRTLPVRIRQNVLPYPLWKFNVPNICWAEYEGKMRKDIIDWDMVAVLLDKANASYDERLLHMRIHLVMKHYHLEGRRLQEKLKAAYVLADEMVRMAQSQNIPVGILDQN